MVFGRDTRYNVRIKKRCPLSVRRIEFGVLVCLLALAACSRSPSHFVDAGNKFLASGKTDDAILQYKKAIQKDPNFGEAHYRLALALLKQKTKAIEAYGSLKRAVELMPDNIDAKVQLADLSLLSYMAIPSRPKRFYDELINMSNQLLAADPNSFEGLRFKGSIAMIDRKPREAIAYLQRAASLKPMNTAVVVDLAQAFLQNNQPAEAERIALEAIERDKTYGPLYDLLYVQYLSTRRPADAESILLKKASNNPKRADYILGLARHYTAANRSKEAAAALARMLDNPKEFPLVYLQTGEFYLKHGNLDEALRLFEKGAQVYPKDKLLYQKGIVNVLLGKGRAEEARKIVEEILKEHPDDADALAVRASVWLGGHDPKRLDSIITDLQTALKQRPEDAELHYNLGRAYAVKGNLKEARAELQKAIRQRVSYLPPRLALADISLKEGVPAEALRFADQVLLRSPGHQVARLQRAVALMGLGKFDNARSELSRLVKEAPQNRDAQMQLGLLAITQKKYSEAEEIFRKLNQPGDPRGLTGLVETYAAQRDFDRAMQLVQDAQKKYPDSMTLHNLLALTAVRAGNYPLAIAEYRRMLELVPNSTLAQINLGEAYRSHGDFPNAIAVLDKARQAAPKDLRAAIALAFTLQKAGHAQEAIAAYRRAIEIEPNHVGILNNLSLLLAETGSNLDEALKLAQRATQLSKQDPTVSDTLGWIYFQKGMHDSALQIFANIAKKQPGNPTFQYHLGVTLLGKGEKEAARKALQSALGRSPTKEEESKIREALARIG